MAIHEDKKPAARNPEFTQAELNRGAVCSSHERHECRPCERCGRGLQGIAIPLLENGFYIETISGRKVGPFESDVDAFDTLQAYWDQEHFFRGLKPGEKWTPFINGYRFFTDLGLTHLDW